MWIETGVFEKFTCALSVHFSEGMKITHFQFSAGEPWYEWLHLILNLVFWGLVQELSPK
jgi:hypothetical protein